MHVLTVMGKTSKWLRNLLTGKKGKGKEKETCGTNFMSLSNPTTPTSSTTPKEKRRWSFRRSSASKESNSVAEISSSVTASVTAVQTATDAENDQQRKHANAMDVVAAAAAEAVICLNFGSNGGTRRSTEEAAAVKIQSVFRSYLVCDIMGS